MKKILVILISILAGAKSFAGGSDIGSGNDSSSILTVSAIQLPGFDDEPKIKKVSDVRILDASLQVQTQTSSGIRSLGLWKKCYQDRASKAPVDNPFDLDPYEYTPFQKIAAGRIGFQGTSISLNASQVLDVMSSQQKQLDGMTNGACSIESRAALYVDYAKAGQESSPKRAMFYLIQKGNQLYIQHTRYIEYRPGMQESWTSEEVQDPVSSQPTILLPFGN